MGRGTRIQPEQAKIQMVLRTFFTYLKGFYVEDVLAVFSMDR